MNAKFGSIQTQSMELKYCERCGTLWLRRAGTRQIHCQPCASAETSSLPDAPVSFLRLCGRLWAEVQA